MKLDCCINFKIQGFCCWIVEARKEFFFFLLNAQFSFWTFVFCLLWNTRYWTQQALDSAAVTFFQMAGACVLLRVKTITTFVVRRHQIAINQTGKTTVSYSHFPCNTGRIYRQSRSRKEFTFIHIHLNVTLKCDYPRYRLSISKGQGKNPCEVLRDRRKRVYLNRCQTWK